jgi:hypothetical protein
MSKLPQWPRRPRTRDAIDNENFIVAVAVIVAAIVGAAGWLLDLLSGDKPRAPFAVKLHAGIVSISREDALNTAAFWVLPNGEASSNRFPAAAVLFFHITNVLDAPIAVERLTFEVTGDNGQWAPLTRLMTTERAEVMSAAGLLLSDATPLLDRVLLQQRELPPKGVAEGWLFLEYPRDLRIQPGTTRYQITLVDATGSAHRTDGIMPATHDPTWGERNRRHKFAFGNKRVDPAAYPTAFRNP